VCPIDDRQKTVGASCLRHGDAGAYVGGASVAAFAAAAFAPSCADAIEQTRNRLSAVKNENFSDFLEITLESSDKKIIHF
jgi:hypothetical protein